jgi:hypothetical protein
MIGSSRDLLGYGGSPPAGPGSCPYPFSNLL